MKNILFIIFPFLIFAQSNFNNFISRVNSVSEPFVKGLLIDSLLLANQNKIPIIENEFAIFIYRGNTQSVSVAGDFNSWSLNSLENLPQTNFYYFAKKFELNARLDYKLVLNGNNWILDPLNSNKIYGGFGPNSELAMPEYIQPWEIKNNTNILHGSIETKNISSINLNANHQLQIYLPPNYSKNNSKKYPTVYFQDGSEYFSLASANFVLDNLIDSAKIEEVIAVFVKPNNRNEEYAGSKRIQYQKFFAEELVPFIDQNYRTITDKKKRLVLGDSYGGNISALIAFNYSELFGNLGIHSGAFQPNNYEIYNLFINSPKKEINITSIWGTYESLFTNMRNFRDILSQKNYLIKTLELPEGHSWGLWRATIDLILQNSFPITTKINDKKSKSENFKIFQNYPNPFNNETIINFNLNFKSFVTLKIYDLLGNEIDTILNGVKDSGFHSAKIIAENYSSGIYFYKLETFENTEIKKMILIR